MNSTPRSRPMTGWLDRLFGLALASALLMLAITAWPGAARAADRVVGSGEAATEQRSPGDFDSIQTQGFKVSVRQGAVPAVSVTADANLLPLLESVVDGRTLVLRWKRGTSLQTRVAPQIQVTVPQLRGLAVQGSGKLLAEALKVPQLRVQISGSGDVQLADISTDELSIDVSGSGDVLAAGQATRLVVKIAGSGDVKAAGLRADDAKVSIAGSGSVDLQAQRTLDIGIAGSGDVRHTGNATVQTKVAGSGKVKKY
ncbi:head GIN domain-containing protein [Aquabacterium sp. OR-4]|uniref:head GIN domain-containing protein n=1 Tax=Aquabacterium sp. OR-4 TaxID=2978127 RepID=UPI0028C5A230|nr:head GIN domain-containing protein [Aquabacterium sp. OR-4]MDT7837439.1 head GIN domain-containing protein [Aquabacterium sp. OR-4]